MMSAVSYYDNDELMELHDLCSSKSNAWEEKKKEYSKTLSKICKEWK